jgi:hypothetical protein
MRWLSAFLKFHSRTQPPSVSVITSRTKTLPMPGTLTPVSHKSSVEQAIREACALYPHVIKNLQKIAAGKAYGGGHAFFFNSNIGEDNKHFLEWKGKSGLRITRKDVNIFGAFTVNGEKNDPETLEILSKNVSRAAEELHGLEKWISYN